MAASAPLALVIGLGASGMAAARLLAHTGWRLRVADTRAAPPALEEHLAALRAEQPATEFVGSALAPELLDGVALLVLSPGLSPTHSAAAAVVQAAQARGIAVAGEIELFARELARLAAFRGYAPRVLGVTGTNGKTTTTALLGTMIEASGRSVAVAGNIGPSALDELRTRLRENRLPEVWVLELSSFQLATTTSLACDAAVVLNLTQDHLDWHGDMDAYASAKARIFARTTVQVLNRDEARVAAMVRKDGAAITFGAGRPRHGNEYGLAEEGGLIWLAWAEDLSPPGRRRKAAAELPGLPGEIHLHLLMPAEALKLRGRHNALNALAALALARAIGCPLAPLLNAAAEFRGEPHRVQFVAQVTGVDYVDDSKGTNVGATVAAIDGLAAEGRRLVLILGGEGKGQDFAPLAVPMQRAARAAVLIGRDAPAIAAVLGGAHYPVEHADSLEEAVTAAARLAEPGDAVVLSPACASFDMFRDYAHRAEVFVSAVRELALEVGQPC
jgi:UDP-N-acetylmuramoylalanine--D-glutamate ligase